MTLLEQDMVRQRISNRSRIRMVLEDRFVQALLIGLPITLALWAVSIWAAGFFWRLL